MAVFFTSDQHFGHANILKYCKRPFSSVEDMNTEIVARWNDVVTANDIVYVLGDFAFKPATFTYFANQLNGTKVFVKGNHDPSKFPTKLWEEPGATIFITPDRNWLHEVVISLEGQRYRLSHYPYWNPRQEIDDDGDPVVSYDPDTREFTPVYPERDIRYPLESGAPTRGGQREILLHGHTHQVDRKRGNMINVGVDAWNFYPVSLEQIKGLL